MRWLARAWLLLPGALLLGAAAAVVVSAPTIDEAALTTPPRLWAGLAAAQAAASAALVAWAAVPTAALLGLATIGRALRRDPAWAGFAGVACWCGGLAALAWFDARLYDALMLRDVRHVADVARLASLRPVVWSLLGGAVWFAAPAVVARGGWAARLVAVAVAIAGCAERWAIHRALSIGPDPRIAKVAAAAPHFVPAEAQRVPWGCVLWKPDGDEWEGISLLRALPREAKGCPVPLKPGSFVRGNPPLFAVSSATAVETLAGWTVEPQGNVGILVRLEAEPPRRFAEWRLSEVRVGVREPPVEGDPRTQPLEGAVLLDAAARGGDLASLLGRALRVELLVLPEAAPTVGDLLQVCGAAVRAHPRGLQCTLAAGSAGAWRTWATPSG